MRVMLGLSIVFIIVIIITLIVIGYIIYKQNAKLNHRGEHQHHQPHEVRFKPIHNVSQSLPSNASVSKGTESVLNRVKPQHHTTNTCEHVNLNQGICSKGQLVLASYVESRAENLPTNRQVNEDVFRQSTNNDKYTTQQSTITDNMQKPYTN